MSPLRHRPLFSLQPLSLGLSSSSLFISSPSPAPHTFWHQSLSTSVFSLFGTGPLRPSVPSFISRASFGQTGRKNGLHSACLVERRQKGSLCRGRGYWADVGEWKGDEARRERSGEEGDEGGAKERGKGRRRNRSMERKKNSLNKKKKKVTQQFLRANRNSQG